MIDKCGVQFGYIEEKFMSYGFGPSRVFRALFTRGPGTDLTAHRPGPCRERRSISW